MGRREFVPDLGIDRNRALSAYLLPSVATILTMVVSFGIVTGILVTWETAITGRLWTRILALCVMYLLPPFVVGCWAGRAHGMHIGPPLAIGVTPVLGLVVALGLFRGPMWSPFARPLLVIVAIAVWSGIAGIGVLLGSGDWPAYPRESAGTGNG